MPDWQDDDVDGLDDIETWMKQRAADVARLNDQQTEPLGRSLWAATTQTDAPISAFTPGDVRNLGASQLDCGPQPATPVANVLGRLEAAGRGAEDAVLLGHGDDVEAGLRSIPSLFSGAPIGSSYEDFLKQAQDQDSYDQAHYPLSRGLGEAAGTGLALIGTDGAAAAMVPRFATFSAARVMPALTNLERGRLALGGAGVGLLGQDATDLLSGHPSGWRDYVGAALGGATIGATGGRLGAVPAAALGGGVTSSADGLLSGQVDPTGVEHSMVAAGYLGGGGQVAGEIGSNALDFRDKGKLGEWLSDAKSFFQGNPVAATQVVRYLPGGGRTVLDGVLTNNVDGLPYETESKFGPTARLRKNQRVYQAQNPGLVRNDYWMPSHVGQLVGGGLSALGLPGIDWADPNRQFIGP
ncbi:MAG TPA: hypothetical protein VHW05_03925 [Phenylobacterium sp.]|nr:hypothetical protein [Phenylobacterium sp.]